MGSTLVHLEPTPHWPPGFLRGELEFGRVYRERHGDELPDTPFWRYLEARDALDPARFRHWHPIVGRWIADQPHPHTITPPVVIIPPTGAQFIGPPPIGTASVPEPGSWILLGIAVVVVFVASHGSRRDAMPAKPGKEAD